VRVDNVSKRFCRSLKRSLWYGLQDLGSELGGRRHGGGGGLPQSSADVELRKDEFWAVKDVSFELRRGECLGLIGRNGAGKTTLLRMLNGLIKPDTGRIEMKGGIGALIALGAGFNPLLTGRENILINGSLLGHSKNQLKEKTEEIIDFSEIEKFIDSPVQSYSSGMQVRLGFAIASTLNPDILLIDEVLAVGDSAFRIKCYNKINRIKDDSAIILVSHSMPQIGKVCNRGIVLEKGHQEEETKDINSAIMIYERLNHTLNTISETASEISNIRVNLLDAKQGRKSIISTASSINNKNITQIKQDHPYDLEVTMTNEKSARLISILISFSSQDEIPVCQCLSEPFFINGNGVPFTVNAGFTSIPLNTGIYSLSIHIMDAHQGKGWTTILGGIRNAIHLSIEKDFFIGSSPVIISPQWRPNV